MALGAKYRQYLHELFSGLTPFTIKPVFGFHGLVADGAMFGVVDGEGRIYLRTDERSRRAYENEGCAPLRVRPRGKDMIETSYFAIPERLYDEPDELREWARRAMDAAAVSPTQVKKRRKRKTARQPLRRRRRS
ncbi:MAG: TfoX/Sxy family protein [Alphaproteobacteria bacterium]